MARDKGLLPFSANFEPQIEAEFDSRKIVGTYADLTNPDTFKALDGLVYIPIGFTVTVALDTDESLRGVYRLNAKPHTTAANWIKLGDGGTMDYDDLTNKPAIDGTTLSSTSTAAGLGLATDDDLAAVATAKQDVLTAGTNITIEYDDQTELTTISATGVTSYNDLTDKPAVDGATLTSASTKAGLGIATAAALADVVTDVSTNTTDISGLKTSVADLEKFKGLFNTAAEIQALPGGEGYYAYCVATETQWTWDEANSEWVDSTLPIPGGGSIPAYDTVPEMNAATGAAGTSSSYARGDHVHPSDTSRATVTALNTHINDLLNPHGVTAAQVGLGNVDNTSDANKPVSTATAAAIALKQNILTAGDRIDITNDTISALEEEYTNPSPSVIAVGGIKVGTTFTDFTFEQLMNELFYPELNPTLTAPSSSFTSSASNLIEVGSTVNITFTSNFNRGTINPAYGTSGFRAGLPNNYVYTGSGLTNAASTALSNVQTVSNYVVAAGSNTWTGRVAYDAGEQPKTSNGNDFGSPLAAGQTSVRTITVTGVYPVFATSVDVGTMTKQALIDNAVAYVEVSMAAEDDTNKQMIDIESTYRAVTGVQFFNTISGQWEWLGGNQANSLTQWTVGTSTHDVQGSTTDYASYVHNSVKVGARQLRFYFT